MLMLVTCKEQACYDNLNTSRIDISLQGNAYGCPVLSPVRGQMFTF